MPTAELMEITLNRVYSRHGLKERTDPEQQPPTLLPHDIGVKQQFDGKKTQHFARTASFHNGTLKGGYLIATAWLNRLECGPMRTFPCGFGYRNVGASFARIPYLQSSNHARHA